MEPLPCDDNEVPQTHRTYPVAIGARLLRKSERWYLAQLRTGTLPGRRTGRSWALSRADILTGLERTRETAGTGPGNLRPLQQESARSRQRPRRSPRKIPPQHPIEPPDSKKPYRIDQLHIGQQLLAISLHPRPGAALPGSPLPMPSILGGSPPITGVHFATAAINSQGRIAAADMLAILGWAPRQPVTFVVKQGLVVIRAGLPSSRHKVDNRRHLRIPADQRSLAGLRPGDRALLVAFAERRSLVVYPSKALLAVLPAAHPEIWLSS